MAEGIDEAPEFRRQLRSWRTRNSLTQQQVAEELGYDVTYIAKLEGGTRPPTRAFLARWSQLAGLSEHTLLDLPMGDISRPPLPQPPAALIGREDTLGVLMDLLVGPARCVTLVGPPGIGKTRLATEAALLLDAGFADGVWWVPLLDVNDAEGVWHSLLRALGIPDRSRSDPAEPVLERLRGHKALVVFDNFEHVIAARQVVSRVVEGSQATVLVTSRESLDIVSEHVLAVTPLVFPDPATNPSYDEVSKSSAVELFVVRATMVQPHFRLTPSNFVAVLAACSQRDGIPLAIVLAAGGLRSVDPAGLVERLQERLDPGVGPADMPPHQRTLEAAIAWSWDLLRDDEREVFVTLAAFSGGFTIEAVAAVDGRDRPQATRLLGDLARKSLVEAQPDAEGGPRFELLETIRSFARSRLEVSGHIDEVRQRHIGYFVAFAEDCGRRLVGPEQIHCARQFEDEFENFRAALNSSLRDDPASAITLASSLWRCFLIGDIPMGRRWLDDALAVAPEPTPARARALAGAGALGWITGHPGNAELRLSEAAALAEQLGLDDVGALVLVNQGALAEQQHRLDHAEVCFTSALAVYERLDDQRGRAVALNGQGMIARRRGDLRQAWALWTEAAALFRDVGDGANRAIALGNKAWAAEVEGRLDEATTISQACLRIQITLGDVRGLAATKGALGRIAFRRGELREARALHLEALGGFQRLGDLPWVASTLLALAGIAEQSGSYEVGAKLVGAAGGVWARMGAGPREEEQERREQVVARCRATLGEDALYRAMADGQGLTLAEAAELAADEPTAGR